MSNSNEEELGAQLLHQMQTVGFCLLVNIPHFDEDKLLAATKKFHALPLEKKMQMALKQFNPGNKNIFHGYFPFLDSDVSHKEFFDMGRPVHDISQWEMEGCPLYEPTPWIQNATEDELGILKAFEDYFAQMHDLALKLLRSLSHGLGKPSNFFDPWFKDACSSEFRAIHYEPRSGAAAQGLNEEEQKLVTPPHADSGFITLLSTFMYDGLQVLIDGEYQSIKPVKNGIVMNIGYTLEKISGHAIKATLHRVLDIGRERYSAPFFFDPKFSARISPKLFLSSRKSAEDLEYEADPENKEEMD